MSVKRGALVPEPPSPLAPPRLLTLKAHTDALHRTFHQDYPPTAFNPGRGKPTRFAPIKDVAGTLIPTLYAGQTLECAYFETVLHDVPPSGSDRVVPYSSIKEWDRSAGTYKVGRQYVALHATRDLRLASLFTPDLKQWNMERRQLIDTTSFYYPETAKWAEALHASMKNIDGLVWTSRQDDQHHCYLLFGDRVAETELIALDGPREIVSDVHLFQTLRACAKAMGARIGEPDPPGIGT